jgi:hypothetical protein
MDLPLSALKSFATTRPVLYGVPAASALGVILGLLFRVGGQIDDAPPPMAMAQPRAEDSAAMIAWPSGKTPDYVIGTDFLAPTRVQQASYVTPEQEFPLLEIPAYRAPEPRQASIEAEEPEAQWASVEGDILDVSLPEDQRPPTEPLQQD